MALQGTAVWYRVASASALVSLLTGCRSGTEPGGRLTPETAHIVTADIPRFWAAFDRMRGIDDTMPLRVDYLDRGTAGLTDFTNLRWRNAQALAILVWPIRDYYASIRATTLGVGALEPEIRRVYRSLDALLARATFPDVYFAIGGLGTGGTTSPHGLLIGTEMFAKAPDSPLDALTPWQQSVVRPIGVLPGIVAHELTHYQQHYGAAPTSLLAQSIHEGSADFIGELLSGIMINEPLLLYGDAHEAEIWKDFSAHMNGTDVSAWLYNGGSITSSSTRPADLGYYVGYRITAAYYAKQTDKRRALRDLLTIADFSQFLAASGYAAKFP